MYITQNIANRIKSRLKDQNINTKTMLTDLDMGINSISEFAKGKQMSCISLAKIADYLGCSVDYLLGRTESPTLDNTQTAGSSINELEAQVILEYRKSDDMTKEMVHRVLHIAVKGESQNLA